MWTDRLSRAAERMRKQKAFKPRAIPTPVWKLICAAAERHDLTPSMVTTKCNSPAPVAARADVMRALRNEGWSYPRIARIFHMHHTTVVAHCQKPATRPQLTCEPYDYSKPDESGIWAI